MSVAVPYTCASAWLAIQCRMIPGVRAAVVRLADIAACDGVPTVGWPENTAASERLMAAAIQCERTATPVISSDRIAGATEHDGRDLIVACPISRAGQCIGAVALAVSGPEGAEQSRAVVQLLTWGTAWLDHLCRLESDAVADDLHAVIDTAAAGLGQATCEAAASAVASRLCRAMGCDRVSVALLDRERARVVAMSDAATVDRKTRLVRDIEAAADEVLCHGRSIAFPADPAQAVWIGEAHQRLIQRQSATAVLTVPMGDQGAFVGALVFERRDEGRFDPRQLRLAEAAALLIGSVLAARRREDRGLVARAGDAAAARIGRVLGPSRLRVKAALLVAAALTGWLALASGVHRVSADAVLEGAVHRALVAPADSYVTVATARAGDLVSAGDVLAMLESEELELERRRWQGEVDELEREHRRAVAALDRPAAGILDAQIGKARARVALVDARIQRSRIVAPIDGVVVKGDLSHSLGAPVQRGQVLFEVAPMDQYQVVLSVPESDIAGLAPGQRGTMALAALPGERFGFTVEQVIGVAGVRDGRNVFRVEARLDTGGELLRPGMHGVGKVELGQRRLLWIWGHDLAERLGLWAWAHLP